MEWCNATLPKRQRTKESVIRALSKRRENRRGADSLELLRRTHETGSLGLVVALVQERALNLIDLAGGGLVPFAQALLELARRAP